MSDLRVRSVTWLMRQISSCITNDPILHNVVIEGEISNFTAHSSGHWYFSLKDDHASIRAVMWENDNLLVNFAPKTGDKIRVLGDVKVYAAQGSVQLVVRRMAPAGEGDLKARFDALFQKLQEEGLFLAEHKKQIPRYPMRIALVSGKETHARADVLNTLARRWPAAEVIEFSSLVQGNRAAADMIQRLKEADRAGCDVILLCRGGGSQEDLWCFNDELLSRTIYALHTPLITGVGHEPDWTMVDYVADLRAPTPTGAAERCSPDIRKVRELLEDTEKTLFQLMDRRMDEERLRLDDLTGSDVFLDPETIVERRRNRKDLLSEKLIGRLNILRGQLSVNLELSRRKLEDSAQRKLDASWKRVENAREDLNKGITRSLEEKRKQLGIQAGLMDAYSPLKVLMRGYSVVMKDHAVVNDAGLLSVKDEITVRMYRGSIRALVKETETGE